MTLRSLVLVLLLPLTACTSALAAAPATAAPRPSAAQWEYLLGETLEYEIGFLWFDRLASGRLTFEPGPEPGTFRASLHARTRGLAASFTRDREETYTSIMELGPDGYLRPRTFTTKRLKGSGSKRSDRAKELQFDFAAGKVVYRKRDNNRITHESVREITPGDHQDLLSAYWNFRMGKYGALERNRRYEIPSLSFKGEFDIVIETLSQKFQSEHPFYGGTEGLLLRITLDRELFDTGGGKLSVWLDNAGRPQRGIVEEVLGIGDVRGVMVKSSYLGPAAGKEIPPVIRSAPPAAER